MGYLIIRRKRIRSLRRHLATVPPGSPITLAVQVTDERGVTLEAIGLNTHPAPGDTVLPAALGPVSRFNAEGREVVRRDLPKEQVTREALWTWQEWHGKDTVERKKIVDIPYWRYPRDFVPPPSVELRCAAVGSGEFYIVVDGDTYTPSNEAALLHRVNLFLELFGEVEILRPDLTPLVSLQLRRLNWEVLPKGRLPWEKLRAALEPILERSKDGNRPVIQARLDMIRSYEPDFHAIGRGGFNGYLVFGFQRLGLYVLESAYYGNATYVLGEDWESLSQLTKAELLNEALHKERVIHRAQSWPIRIRKLLSSGLG